MPEKLEKLKKNHFFPTKLHFITFTICIIAISVSASVSADMAIAISVSASVSADMKIRDIGDYRYQPIWKKAYRSSTSSTMVRRLSFFLQFSAINFEKKVDDVFQIK